MEKRFLTWEEICVSADFTLSQKIILLKYLLTNNK